jgi:3-oxoacyl-[acyl-carrier protein] reductase
MTFLENRHILVVGGSRGIGAATARLCAESGANVSIVYRSNQAAAEGVLADIRKAGRKGFAAQADASDETEISAAIAKATQELGPLHGLVISAGIFEGLPLAEMTVEFWERTMSQNLRSTFLAVKHAVPHMETGSIVIYTSTAGQRGSAVFSAYATSKGAQIMFMRSMALELAPKIRVNCIAPAWTETEMADASLTALGRDDVAAKFPLGRIGQPEDVAGATLFLLSDLSRFVTGTTVTVDGGMDMRG